MVKKTFAILWRHFAIQGDEDIIGFIFFISNSLSCKSLSLQREKRNADDVLFSRAGIFCRLATVGQRVVANGSAPFARNVYGSISRSIWTLAACRSTCLGRSGITVGRGYVVSGTTLPKTDKIPFLVTGNYRVGRFRTVVVPAGTIQLPQSCS